MTAPTTPPVPHPPSVVPSVAPSARADQPAPAAPGAATPVVGELLSRLDGLEHRPLSAQVEVLDAVRRGLDQALSPAPQQR